MENAKRVLILGGGVGGLVAANTLRKLLPKSCEILVIDQAKDHLFAPSLLWLMVGKRKPKQIARPLDRLRRKGIGFVHGQIERIVPERRLVQVSGREITGDALIVSLGADLAPEAIAGLKESGHNLYTPDGATGIFRELSAFKGGKIAILTAAPAYKCPAAPYEAAMLVEDFCRRRGIRDRTQIDLHAAEPGPMLTVGAELSAAVRQMVEAKGIRYHPGQQVTSVDKNSRRIRFENGETAEFDLLFYVPPHKAPDVAKQAGLLAESGWVAVDRNTLETQFADVFAIGDITAIPLKMGRPLPKAGVFAHGQAEVVARNIAAKWSGSPEKSAFEGFGECFIEVGAHRAGMGTGNFYAEPLPSVKMRRPAIHWHLAKIWFEKYWLHKWF